MKFKRLESAQEILDLIDFHNKHSEFVVIDVETTAKNPRKCEAVDIQISGHEEDGAFIFSAKHGEALEKISKGLTLVAHNHKFDLQVLFRHGVNLMTHKWRDTLLIGHLLDENRETYKLDSYVKEYWNDSYKGSFWKEDGGKYGNYLDAPEEERVDYACRDIVYTGRLYRRMLSDLNHDGIPERLIEHVHRLQASLLWTEIEGIRIDLDYLQELGVKLKLRIDELRPKMRSMVKRDVTWMETQMYDKRLSGYKTDKGRASAKRPRFSFESSQQLQSLLYDQLGLPVQRNEKTKQVSTDYASLDKLRNYHPVIELIQENRELQKVYTAYIEGTLDRIDQERIYPEFRVAGTVTGRLSHSNPNLAQLPKQGGVRGIYVPDRGRVLISADYSQLEVVLEANLTGDKSLIHMLENGESKHDLTARELGCDRNTAKTLNFALQYWASHYKVAKLLNCSVDEGKRIWEKYWDIYRGPKELKIKTDKMVDDGISLVTAFGRKRRFEHKKRSSWDGDYRQAYNFLIQSTGADITSRAFYLVAEELKETGAGRALFSVHDEIIIEVDEAHGEYWNTRLPAVMCRVGDEIGLEIPLKAEASGPCLRWED